MIAFVSVLTFAQVQRKAEENVAGIEWDDDSEGLIED